MRIQAEFIDNQEWNNIYVIECNPQKNYLGWMIQTNDG